MPHAPSVPTVPLDCRSQTPPALPQTAPLQSSLPAVTVKGSCRGSANKAESDRLQLAVLVAKHVWGDPAFAAAAAARYAEDTLTTPSATASHTTIAAALYVRGDCRDGVGKRAYEDGSEYEGDWKAGEQHGVGTFRYSGKRKGMLASTLRHTGFFLAGPFVFPSFFFLVSSSVGKTGSVRRAVSRYVNAAAPD